MISSLLSMSGHDERVAANEARARLENEQRTDWFVTHGLVLFACECFRPECESELSLSREDYERVRADPTHFSVAAGHVDDSVEIVVERLSTFWVTEKATPDGRAVTIESDPRS